MKSLHGAKNTIAPLLLETSVIVLPRTTYSIWPCRTKESSVKSLDMFSLGLLISFHWIIGLSRYRHFFSLLWKPLLLIKRTKKKQITFSNNVKTSTTPHHHKNKQSNTRNSGKSAQNSTNNTKKVNSKRLMESSSNSLTRFLTPTKFANQPAKIYPMSSLRFTRTSFLAKNDMRYWITSARLLVRRSLIAMTALVIIVKPQLQI